MSIKKDEHERHPASPPASPPKPGALQSINEPGTPSDTTGDLPSINEPPRPKETGHDRSPQVTDVSREAKRDPENDHGSKRHR